MADEPNVSSDVANGTVKFSTTPLQNAAREASSNYYVPDATTAAQAANDRAEGAGYTAEATVAHDKAQSLQAQIDKDLHNKTSGVGALKTELSDQQRIAYGASTTAVAFNQAAAAYVPSATPAPPTAPVPPATPASSTTHPDGGVGLTTPPTATPIPAASPTPEPISRHADTTPAHHADPATLKINHPLGASFTQTGAGIGPSTPTPATPAASTTTTHSDGGAGLATPAPASHTSAAAAPASHPDGGIAPTSTVAYSVRKGDTLSGIAATHHVSLAELEALNPQIKNPNLILPGETVHLSSNMPTSSTYATIVGTDGTPGVLTGTTGQSLATNKKGLLGNLLGRLGKGGNTEGTTPPADPAKTIAADPTKAKPTEPAKPLS